MHTNVDHVPVKILLVANTDWYLYNFRFSLARALVDQGYQVVLVSPPGKYVERFKENGLTWKMWQVGRQSVTPWSEVRSLISLGQIYRQEKPDLIHHHTIKPVLYGSLAARALGIRNVVNSITGRGYVFLSQEARAFAIKQITQPLYRLAFSQANYAAIFENRQDQQYFIDKRFIRPDRTWLISGVGVDTDRFTPARLPDGLPVILFSGRMLWDKGVGVLVQAAQYLNKKIRLRIVLVGEPDPGNPASISTDQLRAWVNEGWVEWWGWQADMNSVYNQAHIVTSPTTYGEGVPTVLLEAGACGRPVVASDTPGCREIVQDGVNGLFVPPNDPEALAEALYKLATDADLRGRMGNAGRRIVLERFTVDQVNAATLSVYQEVLAPSVTRRDE